MSFLSGTALLFCWGDELGYQPWRKEHTKEQNPQCGGPHDDSCGSQRALLGAGTAGVPLSCGTPNVLGSPLLPLALAMRALSGRSRTCVIEVPRDAARDVECTDEATRRRLPRWAGREQCVLCHARSANGLPHMERHTFSLISVPVRCCVQITAVRDLSGARVAVTHLLGMECKRQMKDMMCCSFLCFSLVCIVIPTAMLQQRQ
jgi:hypothetical protein